MSNSKYYLVIVTKNNCPACDTLKGHHLQKIILGSEKTYLTPVKLFNYVNDQLPANEQMPKDLSNYFYYLPAAILVTKESYELALQHPEARLSAIPFNLKIDAQGKKILEDSKKNIEEQVIMEWIDKHVGRPNGNYDTLRSINDGLCTGSMGSRSFRFGI